MGCADLAANEWESDEWPTNHEVAPFVITRAFHRSKVGCGPKSLLDKRAGLKTAAEPSVIDPVRRLSSKATIRPGDESAIELSLRKPSLAGCRDGPAFALRSLSRA
jgi:hypothetical protein